MSSLKVTLLSRHDHNAILSEVGLDTPTLVTAYLAWAFQRLRKPLATDSYSNIFVNLAAPMSHFRMRKLKNKYLQIVQAAWTIAFGQQGVQIYQGISSTEVTRLVRPLLAAPVMGSEQRRFEILPKQSPRLFRYLWIRG